MNSQDKNTMMRNLRHFIEKGKTGLYDYQDDALVAVEKFMRLPNGAEFTQAGTKETEEKGIKKGDYLEVVSATGSGKTRMFGTMAKVMDVPTLIVTPRNVLNKRIREEFCDEIGIAKRDIAIYDGYQSKAKRKHILEGNPPPKFVITSYQSLRPLVDKHELDFTNRNDVHYRPLIILDEVHEAQGPKTSEIINKLKNNVLLVGFTATDAGVASNLFEGQKPIYHLPIAEAIKRDILCNGVVTGTIDVTIDEGWIKNFAKTRKGREYKREDLEKFAVTPSVLEGAIRYHLTENRDGFGKLSRLPTVFYTEGVEAARYGAERFNAMAKELGVNAKAAYVSGDMGHTQYGPILEKFKKGNIQAVFNDKLIGMGFDARNATVCYSLKPSNLPHVVEQQLGRIIRGQDKDYLEKYDQDKLALAINVRAKHMNPYLYGQVLGSAALYSDKYIRRPVKEPLITKPPVEKEYNHAAGIKVRIDYNEMQSVISDANQQREGLPQKTEEWLSGTKMSELSRTHCGKAYRELEEAWRQAKEKGEKSFTAAGITLPVYMAGIFRNDPHKTFCVHKDMLERFSTPQKTEDWLIYGEMNKAARIESRIIYKSLEKAWRLAKEKGEKSFSAEGITLPVDKAGIFQSHTIKCFCIHKDMVSHFSTPQKTEGFLTSAEMGALAHVSPITIRPLYEKLEKSWLEAKEKGETSFIYDGITIPTDKAGIFQSNKKRTFYIHKDMVSHFSTPQKTEDFLAAYEMAREAHIGDERCSQLYNSLKTSWQEAKRNGETNFTAEGITLPINKAGIFKSHASSTFFVHKDMAHHFSTQQKPEDFLASYEMAKEAHIRTTSCSQIYDSLKTSWQEAKRNGVTSFTAEGITLSVNKAGIFKNNIFCLHKDAVSHFSTPEKTVDFLTSKEMANYKHIGHNRTYPIYHEIEKAWQEAKEKGNETFIVENITFPIDKVGLFRSLNSKRQPFCVHKDMVEDIVAHLRKEKPSKTSFTEMVGDKKTISPDSEDLKRTGRVRGS